MIYKETVLSVVDSSGAKKARCIHVYKNLPYASVGDVIRVSIVSSNPSSKIKKGTVHKAVVVQTVSSIKRTNGIRVSFNKNSVILLNEKMEPVTNRGIDYVSIQLKPEFRSVSKGVI